MSRNPPPFSIVKLPELARGFCRRSYASKFIVGFKTCCIPTWSGLRKSNAWLECPPDRLNKTRNRAMTSDYEQHPSPSSLGRAGRVEVSRGYCRCKMKPLTTCMSGSRTYLRSPFLEPAELARGFCRHAYASLTWNGPSEATCMI